MLAATAALADRTVLYRADRRRLTVPGTESLMSTDQVVSGLSCAAGRDRGGLLRRSLQLGAVAADALGVLWVAAGPALDELLSTPVALPVPVGVFLLADAARLELIGSRARVSRPALWAVIAGTSCG